MFFFFWVLIDRELVSVYKYKKTKKLGQYPALDLLLVEFFKIFLYGHEENFSLLDHPMERSSRNF